MIYKNTGGFTILIGEFVLIFENQWVPLLKGSPYADLSLFEANYYQSNSWSEYTLALIGFSLTVRWE